LVFACYHSGFLADVLTFSSAISFATVDFLVYQKQTLAYFEDDGLLVCWLPPYCSDLNPIERFWGHLKSFACANKLFASVTDLVASARRCLDNQNNFVATERFLFLNT
jgi:hypothetical protein